MRSPLLLVDAAVNILLGLGLVWFPASLVERLGIPATPASFYPAILGAVLFGIGIALLLDLRRSPRPSAGLGLHGAVAINLSGAVVLMGWLLFGGLGLPVRGQVFLWALALLLVGLSTMELVAYGRRPEYRRVPL